MHIFDGCVEITPSLLHKDREAHSICWVLMAEKQLCKKGLGGPGGQEVEDEPAMCRCGTAGQQLPRPHQQNRRSKELIISLYFSTFEVLIRLPYPVWGFQQKFIDKLE